MIFESMSQFVQHQIEAEEFYLEVVAEATSHAPGSVGQQIRINAIEEQADNILDMVIVDQLWDNQIDMYGRKLPTYKADTVRKKAKLGHPADKLVNYTQMWSGTFYERGIELQVFESSDTYGIGKTNAMDYFQYIPDDDIGLTEENKAKLKEILDRITIEAQLRYIHQRIDESPYADILTSFMYFGHDFSV